MPEIDALVIDIGKTNLKVSVGSPGGLAKVLDSTTNYQSSDGPYPHFDVDAIWDWLLVTLADAAAVYPIRRICVAAHGAAAALVHKNADAATNGLILPVMDYEWDGVRELDEFYDMLRPPFSESFSPALSAGLNLGRQIFWQSKRFPREFAQTNYIVPYPQYWSWRLTGVAKSEVSSLGSHTDLWAPRKKAWSSLVVRTGWEPLFAPIAPAWEPLGAVLPAIAEQTGIDPNCVVVTGVHDSNASYSLFEKYDDANKPTVVSTGTWTVILSPYSDIEQLDEGRDMLLNVDITGTSVACARFMGGREFSEICALTGRKVDESCTLLDVRSVIENKIFALPDFSKGSGPFGGRRAEIVGMPENGVALATLYAALMVDFELDLMCVKDPIVIEGSFAENELLCSLVAALQENRKIYRLLHAVGVASGCLSIIARVMESAKSPNLLLCSSCDLNGLVEYRDAWRCRCEKTSEENDA